MLHLQVLSGLSRDGADSLDYESDIRSIQLFRATEV